MTHEILPRVRHGVKAIAPDAPMSFPVSGHTILHRPPCKRPGKGREKSGKMKRGERPSELGAAALFNRAVVFKVLFSLPVYCLCCCLSFCKDCNIGSGCFQVKTCVLSRPFLTPSLFPPPCTRKWLGQTSGTFIRNYEKLSPWDFRAPHSTRSHKPPVNSQTAWR